MTQQRQSNLEALRIVSILLILLMHVYSQVSKAEMTAGNHLLGLLINGIGNIGVTCFVLLSGYFGIKFKAYRFIQLIMLTTLYTLIVHVANNGIQADSDMVSALLVVPLYRNWFIACYLILMLLAPFINEYLDSILKERFKKLLFIQFIMFSVLPTLFNTPYYTILTGGGKCLVYLIFVYMTGRYLRKYYDTNVEHWKAGSAFIVMTAAICILNALLSHIMNRRLYIYSLDCSPFILASAISIFYLFKSFAFQKRWVNYIASSVLAAYLLDGLRGVADRHIVHLERYTDSGILPAAVLAVVLITFCCAIAIDKITTAVKIPAHWICQLSQVRQ